MYQGSAALALAPGPQLTVLSHGLGQDSSTILLMYLHDHDFRSWFAPNDFIVVFSETGNEHDYTYKHLIFTMQLCKQHGIPFFHVTPDLGFHVPSWPSLNEHHDAAHTVGGKRFKKSCTAQLKITPIYNLVEQYLGQHYVVRNRLKQGYYQFLNMYGQVRVIIGLTKGEENRVADPSKLKDKWKRDTVEMSYPLIELGTDRQGCQNYHRKRGYEVPFPSNCKRCPYMSEQELVWMYKFENAEFWAWVAQEKRKLVKFADKGDRNIGVWGDLRTLPEVLAEALDKYGHWSDQQLMEYKMSHGHCVASQY